jgi:hypothetical protein
MRRFRFILVGAVAGLAWSAALRGYMMQLAGPASAFTFGGTFGIILPTGTSVGALLGWAEFQRRAGHRHRLLIAAPLLLAVLPCLLTASFDSAPVVLALIAMIGGYAVSGRGPRWARIVAGLIVAGAVVVPFVARQPSPDLSTTTPHGAWAATLLSSLFVVFALACSIPMHRPDPTGTGAAWRPNGEPATMRPEEALSHDQSRPGPHGRSRADQGRLPRGHLHHAGPG